MKEVLVLSFVCKSLYKSSQDNGVWEKHFPNETRLRKYIEKYKGQNINKRDLFIHDMKVINNMTIKKRYQNYNLDGHTDHIMDIDAKNGIIVSGSKD